LLFDALDPHRSHATWRGGCDEHRQERKRAMFEFLREIVMASQEHDQHSSEALVIRKATERTREPSPAGPVGPENPHPEWHVG
jgi:hypothetical protein